MIPAAEHFADEEPDHVRLAFGITTDTADEDVPGIAAAMCVGEDVELVDVADFVRFLRDGARDVVRTGLEELSREITALTQERTATIRRIASWGDSAEVLGALTGMSPADVEQALDG